MPHGRIAGRQVRLQDEIRGGHPPLWGNCPWQPGIDSLDDDGSCQAESRNHALNLHGSPTQQNAPKIRINCSFQGLNAERLPPRCP
jgi:hypothetical protein